MDPKILDEIARKLGIGKYESKPNQSNNEPNSSLPTGISITELDDRYVLDGISYRNGLYQVSWGKELLDGGKCYTQKDWLALQNKGELGEYIIPDAPLYHASLFALNNAKNGSQDQLVKKISKMFRKDFADFFMTTSSRVFYRANGLDEIKHMLCTDEEYSVELDFCGKDGWLNATCGFEESIDALLVTKDLAEVEDIYNWVSGKKPYLWRINDKPQQDLERCVVLGVDSNGDGFGILANGDVDNERPARGVVVGKFFSSGNKR